MYGRREEKAVFNISLSLLSSFGLFLTLMLNGNASVVVFTRGGFLYFKRWWKHDPGYCLFRKVRNKHFVPLIAPVQSIYLCSVSSACEQKQTSGLSLTCVLAEIVLV